LAALKEALTLAEPEGYVRLLIDEGAPVAALLQEAYKHSIAPGYAGKLLAAFGAGEIEGKGLEVRQAPARPPHASVSLLVEPLSPRELELLHLVAAGQTNLEIAQQLFLAVGTVKKHLNNIFGKLDVSNRTEAIARARELNLL
jgi:LuxR family maltose regulon positive regulatory protein